MMFYIVSLAVVLVVLFVSLELLDRPLEAMFLKALASFGFIMVFAYAFYQYFNASYESIWPISSDTIGIKVAVLFLLGLVAGLIGDLILALRPLQKKEVESAIIIAGIVAFSIGHVFYYSGLLVIHEFNVIPILFALAITLSIYITGKRLSFEMGRAEIPVLIYSFLIFLMVGQAIVTGIFLGFDAHMAVLSTGAVLFAVSDAILAFIYFRRDHRKPMVILNLSTYYAAQLLIALSFYFL
ncbi:MAG: lysoplasmalogenase family protein [Acholeplasmataceae bacterium]